MARRDITIPPYRAPGGTAVQPTEIEFALVDESKVMIPGMRTEDDEGVIYYAQVTTGTAEQTISLTPQSEFYGTTYWRTRIRATVDNCRGIVPYTEYFSSMPAGDPMTLREFLQLGSPMTPGVPPDWETHLTEPDISDLHNPKGALEGQIPVWDATLGEWVAKTPTAVGTEIEFPYAMVLPATAAPAAGQVSRDNDDPTLVTTIFVNEVDGNSQNQSASLALVKAGDWTNLQLASDAGQYEQYDATGPGTLGLGVWSIPVVFHGQTTTLNDGDAIDLYWRISTAAAGAAIEDLTSTSPAGKIAETDGAGGVTMVDTPAEIEEPVDDANPKMRQTDTGVSTWVASGDAATKDVGTTAGTVAEGDHLHTGVYDPAGSAAAVQSNLDDHEAVAVISSDSSVADAVTLTQAEYDLLAPPDPNTLYLICEDAP